MLRRPMALSTQINLDDPEHERNYLLLETHYGEGELVSAAQISKLLKQGIPRKLDLVVLQAC